MSVENGESWNTRGIQVFELAHSEALHAATQEGLDAVRAAMEQGATSDEAVVQVLGA